MQELLIVGATLLGIIITMISIPPIVRVAKAKNLFEPFESRKVHTKTVPPLGGVAIFIGFVISTIVATDGYSFDSLKYIIASIILMFFIGLKDDLMNIPPRKKLIVQVFASALLITLGKIQFTNLHGILGFYEINPLIGMLISLVAMIGVINAFNLVDGIDGLASGLAMLAATVFGVWFYIAGNLQFAIMSFALIGSLAGFFVYNVFGHKNKLFMGDTGSLVIGLIISTLVIVFNESNILQTTSYAIGAAPAVSLAAIVVPVIDTLRVMILRILKKRSPFAPDKIHVHHNLLRLIPNHLKVTLIIVIANCFIVGFGLLFNNIGFNVNYQLLLIVLMGVVLSVIPWQLAKAKQRRNKKQEEFELKNA